MTPIFPCIRAGSAGLWGFFGSRGCVPVETCASVLVQHHGGAAPDAREGNWGAGHAEGTARSKNPKGSP